VRIRLLAGSLLVGLALTPLAASANTGCRYIPGGGVTDPDVVGTACATGARTLAPLCTKYNLCTE
jgi:hypothetical protein